MNEITDDKTVQTFCTEYMLSNMLLKLSAALAVLL